MSSNLFWHRVLLMVTLIICMLLTRMKVYRRVVLELLLRSFFSMMGVVAFKQTADWRSLSGFPDIMTWARSLLAFSTSMHRGNWFQLDAASDSTGLWWVSCPCVEFDLGWFWTLLLRVTCNRDCISDNLVDVGLLLCSNSLLSQKVLFIGWTLTWTSITCPIYLTTLRLFSALLRWVGHPAIYRVCRFLLLDRFFDFFWTTWFKLCNADLKFFVVKVQWS